MNFQNETGTVPTGYLRDFGEAYGARSGANQGSGLSYGWVVPGSSTPLSLIGNGRDRNAVSDQRLDTLMHMQGNDVANFNGIAKPGAWEISIPNGTYTVTVSVGDASTVDNSVHRINLEGQPAITGFAPTATTKFASATRTVTVADGRLTVDATGGTNTKLNYLYLASAATDFTQVAWSTVAPTPLPRHEGASAVVNGRLYAFGGYVDATTPGPRVDSYDPLTNSWRQETALPVATTHMGVAVDGTDVYLAGGYPIAPGGSGHTYSTSAVWRYSTTTGIWTAMPDLPAPRGGGALVALGRTLHFFGGSDAARLDAADHRVLSLDGGGWTSAAPLPQPRNHLAGIAVGNALYAVGGQTGQYSAAVYLGTGDGLGPADGTPGQRCWTRRPPLARGLRDSERQRPDRRPGRRDRRGHVDVAGGRLATGRRRPGPR